MCVVVNIRQRISALPRFPGADPMRMPSRTSVVINY